MEQMFNMDKKNATRSASVVSKNGQDSSKPDYASRKKVQNFRKRESEKFENGKRSSTNRGCRSGQWIVRPREKVGCQVKPAEPGCEFGSVQRAGGKKQNIAHLLDWWGPAGSHGQRRGTAGHFMGRKRLSSQYRYNKEHFLQANCQFVVSHGPDYSIYDKDPDQLVHWELVEEVRLHCSDPPKCPICLYPPVAAKVTKCGHIFCFACILHYLALSDEKWRKCPICFDAIMKTDLKSAVAILHKEFNQQEEISLSLMCRERDSLIPSLVSQRNASPSRQLSSYSNMKQISPYSKLIIATKEEVSKNILDREYAALNFQMMKEKNEPESCFIEEALKLLQHRELTLNVFHEPTSSVCTAPSVPGDALKCTQTVSNNEFFDYFDQLSVKSNSQQRSMDCEGAVGFSTPADEHSVCVEDLDISHYQKVSNSQECKNAPKSLLYFYQESNGAHIYLHALNVQMLVKEYGSLENCPHTLKGTIIEKESISMTEQLRNRLRYLRHLPLSSPFDVVELHLSEPKLSSGTIIEFQESTEQRVRNRKRREREEQKVEKRAQDDENRMMGRGIQRTVDVHLQSAKHFPTFQEDPPLVTPLEEEEASSYDAHSDSTAATSPSFAQMIRTGQRSDDYPSLRTWPTRTSREVPLARLPNFYQSDEEDGDKVPNFSTSFSDAFAKALDEAAKQPKEATSVSKSGGKKRKQKRVLLLSSGCR